MHSIRSRVFGPIAFGLVLGSCGAAPEFSQAWGDLATVRERGRIRILVAKPGENWLLRQARPHDAELDEAVGLAEHLGVASEVIPVPRQELLTSLKKGYGDIVATSLSVTPAREAEFLFTRPIGTVSEWLIGARTQSEPSAISELSGMNLHIPWGSVYSETVSQVEQETGARFVMSYADANTTTESLVYDVSVGRRPFTVADSDELSAIESYNKDFVRLIELTDARPRAWAVRKTSPELLAAADSYLIANRVTGHRAEPSTGDLDTIRERGSLRVLTANNSVNYFIYRGRLFGFDYEIAKLAAERLGVRLDMIVPPNRDVMIEWLLSGRGDVIASGLTVTAARQRTLAFSRPYWFADEVLVEASSAEQPTDSFRDLQGKTIHVWESSSHFRTMTALQREYGPFTIALIPADISFEQILERVVTGQYAAAVVDSYLLDAELGFREDIRRGLAVNEPDITKPEQVSVASWDRAIAFAVRPENVHLKKFLDEFVEDLYGKYDHNLLVQRYFQTNVRLRKPRERRVAITGALSPYDDLFKRYGRRYGLDWRLLAAQSYEESLFDPNALSRVGARGLFQLLPTTAMEMGFDDLEDPESGIHAGVRYMSKLIDRFEPEIDLKHRIRFALASYNAGFGHVLDARRLAERQGLDRDRWFGQTERAMLLLSEPRHYRRAQHGFVRGKETVRYVSQIQNRYDHYVTLVPQ